MLADETQDYKVTVEQLEAARTDRTKVLLFVSPSNPTGAVYTSDEIRAIGRWVEDHQLWVLTDEIYEHLVYDGVDTGSMPVLCPFLADNCVVVNGVAKTYAMTGWRVGWMIGPVDLVKAATNLQSHATSQRLQRRPAGRDRRGQRRPDRGRGDEGRLRPAPQDDRGDAQRDRRRRLPDAARRVLRLPVGQGTARQGARRRGSSRPRPSSAEYILDKAEVAVVPGEAFGSPGYLRLSYALGDDDLVEGITRLQKLFA